MKQSGNYKKLTLTAVFLMSMFSGLLLQAQEKDQPNNNQKQNKQKNQPVTPEIDRIVLYKNGLAYFERTAAVQGDQEIRLQFKEDQMKDLLSSFFAVDLGGGSVTNITFDSKAPISRQMEDLLIDIPETDTTAALLKQLQGTPVKFALAGSEVSGKIMGIQTKKEAYKDGKTVNYTTVTLLTDTGNITHIDLRDVRNFEIRDPNLKREVNQYLKLRLQGKHRKKKNMTVHTRGKGKRGVLIGYQIEAPVWKSSYRLLFRKNQEPILLGWATVENQTTEDWNDVRVQLVAGNPVSFEMDLYTPFYPERPKIPISVLFPETNLRSLAGVPGEEKQIIQKEMKKMARKADRARAPQAESSRKLNGRAGAGMGAGGRSGSRASNALKNIQAGASGEALGEMFSYTIDKKISVARGKSAMVPILNTPVEGNRVIYFNESVSAHPMNSFHLKNSTDLTLDNGPVTVFQEGTSLGEALISNVMKPGMKTMLPYAVESGMEIKKTVKSEQEQIHRIEIRNGVLTGYRAYLKKTEYEIRNRIGEDRTVVIDHPEQKKFELASPESAEEKIENLYRFKQEVDGMASKTLTVVEKRIVSRTHALQNLDLNRIQFWLNQKELSDSQEKLLRDMQNLMAQIHELNQRKKQSSRKVQNLVDDQQRYRRNMRSLTNSREEREVRSKYVEKLQKAEKEIEEERTRQRTLENNINELQKKLKQMIDSYSNK